MKSAAVPRFSTFTWGKARCLCSPPTRFTVGRISANSICFLTRSCISTISRLNKRRFPNQDSGSGQKAEERLILLVFHVNRPSKAFRPASAESRKQLRNPLCVGVVGGEQLAQMLLLQFHHRQVDQQ